MTKYKIAKVDVHITSVIFPSPKSEPAEAAADGTEETANA